MSAVEPDVASSRERRARSTAWAVVVVLAIIGIAAAVRRALVLTLGIGVSPATAALDAGFAAHPVLTFVHIVPGALFMALAPLQFVRSIRTRRLWLHRWLGRVLVIVASVVGVSALSMSAQLSIGGASETAATTLFAVLFLLALTKAVSHVRNGRIHQHREWMIRMFAIGLGVATTRPIVGAFFAASGLEPREFFGIAFWLGFTLTALAGEIWIRMTRRRDSLMGGGEFESKARSAGSLTF